MSYEINYDDQKFKDVEADKKSAISDLEKTYSGMVNDSDAFYKAQVDASKQWEKQQTELQNQQTDFAIKEINQKKDQAKKDYTKEQSGAYQDWKKQSDPTGVRAEQIADMGMQNTGYSESSQVSMFNTYQNRVSTARESYNRIVLDFDNAITQARLQNNSALAEIAYKSLQQRLELNLQGFQYKNSLLLEQAKRKTELEQIYREQWKDVLDQMNSENALSEEIRQFNEQMAFEREQFDWQKANFNRSSGGGGRSGGGSGGGSNSRSKSNINDKTDINAIADKTYSSSGLPKETRDSLVSLGYAGKSANYVASQVAAGNIVEKTSSSGNPVYSAGKSSNIANDTSAYWSSRKF